MFKEFGTIVSVAFKRHFSFVTFQRDSEAEKAVKELHERNFHGNTLKVEIVENRRARKTGPSASDDCFKCRRRGHWLKIINIWYFLGPETVRIKRNRDHVPTGGEEVPALNLALGN